MWPASAMLTGNGVAFILRVPGTQHGDWWSLRGWWIFVGTAAISLLSKYVIKWRGGHVFNPSNFGLVLCFLVLGRNRAEPLDFWWGGMSPWLGLAFVVIVSGGLADPLAPAAALDRRRLLALLRCRHRRPRGERPRDDGALAPRPDRRLELLVGAAQLARGARLPLLHADRPEDVAEGAARARRLCRERRAARRVAHRAADDGVGDEGGPAHCARDRLRGAAAARACAGSRACASRDCASRSSPASPPRRMRPASSS